VWRGGRALDKPAWPYNQDAPLRHQICPRHNPPHPCVPVHPPCIADLVRPQNALDCNPCLADRDPHRITTPHHASDTIHTARSYFNISFLACSRTPHHPKSHLPLRMSFAWFGSAFAFACAVLFSVLCFSDFIFLFVGSVGNSGFVNFCLLSLYFANCCIFSVFENLWLWSRVRNSLIFCVFENFSSS